MLSVPGKEPVVSPLEASVVSAPNLEPDTQYRVSIVDGDEDLVAVSVHTTSGPDVQRPKLRGVRKSVFEEKRGQSDSCGYGDAKLRLTLGSIEDADTAPGMHWVAFWRASGTGPVDYAS